MATSLPVRKESLELDSLFTPRKNIFSSGICPLRNGDFCCRNNRQLHFDVLVPPIIEIITYFHIPQGNGPIFANNKRIIELWFIISPRIYIFSKCVSFLRNLELFARNKPNIGLIRDKFPAPNWNHISYSPQAIVAAFISNKSTLTHVPFPFPK